MMSRLRLMITAMLLACSSTLSLASAQAPEDQHDALGSYDNDLCQGLIGQGSSRRLRSSSRIAVYMDTLESDLILSLSGLPVITHRDRSNVSLCLTVALSALRGSFHQRDPALVKVGRQIAKNLVQYPAVQARLTVYSADKLSEYENQKASESRAILLGQLLREQGAPSDEVLVLGDVLPLPYHAASPAAFAVNITLVPKPTFYSF